MKKNSLILSALLLALGFGGACSCGQDSTGSQRSDLSHGLDEDPSRQADFVIEFGLVALGDRKTREIEFKNHGSAPLAFQLEPVGLPFLHDSPPAGRDIGPGGTVKIRASFEPVEETGAPVQQIIRLTTNEGAGKSYSIRLIGQGVKAVVECAPAAIDFGQVLRGTSQTLSTTCTNPLTIPLELKADRFKGTWGQWFRAEIDGASDGWMRLDSGAELEVLVHFSAGSLGPNEATLELQDPYGQRLAAIPVSAEAVENTTVVSPSCLDFSYVEVGKTKRDTLKLKNIGVSPVMISSMQLPAESAAHFSILTQGPLTLEPGAPATLVEIEFHPSGGGPQQTAVDLHLVEAGEAKVITGCARGFGGGPALACDRESLDFGAVAVGMEGFRRLHCINGGQPAPGLPLDPLVVEEITVADPLFRVAKITNQDGSEGLKPSGYESGEGFEVQLAYGPQAERFDSAELQLHTPGLTQEVHSLPISGQGRILPPCEFEIRPPQIRFGVVERGSSLTLPLAITNLQGFACLVDDLHLTEDSSPAFELEALEAFELGGFETLRVDVTFSPTEHGRFEGAVEFRISDPENPAQRVELIGASQTPCLLIEPKVLDFGRVRPGCMTAPVQLIATNTCSSPLVISSIEIADVLDEESFRIIKKPQSDWVLVPTQWAEVDLVFAPEKVGNFESAIIVEVEGSEPYVATLIGEGSENPIQTDLFEQTGRPKVDILWVMDNSGSFEPFQERIGENLPAFLELATLQGIDFRIAVTTSGLDPVGGGCPGGASGGEGGRFFPVDGSSPRLLSPFTADLERHWKSNIHVGTCHGVEEYLEAAYRALSEPLINEVKSSKHWSETPYDDGNVGFLRKEASLSIIFVADERDQSTHYGKAPLDYLAFFRSLKGYRMFKAHAITGGRRASNCLADEGDRLLELVERTDGTWLDICTPTDDTEAWTNGLRSMSEGAFSFTRQFFLRGMPSDQNGDGLVDEEDIELIIDGRVEPPVSSGGQERWSYDARMNSITFSPLFIPPPSSQITATYEVGCYQP